MQHAIARDAQDVGHHLEIDAQMFTPNLNPAPAPPEDVNLEQNPDAAPGRRGDGRSGHTQAWKWAQSQDEAGIETEIDEVRELQDTHGNRSIARAAEDGVDQEQHQDDSRPAQHDPAVG